MKQRRLDLLQGTLDMLILTALSGGPQHGYGVARTIERSTNDILRVEEGSLYPALHRMQERGWVRSSWGQSENNRRAKFYELTDEGRRQLSVEAAEWERYSHAVAQMLRNA
jgi:PadR family transcriptional regulator